MIPIWEEYLLLDLKKYHAGVSEIHDLFLLQKLHVKHDLVAWDFNDLWNN